MALSLFSRGQKRDSISSHYRPEETDIRFDGELFSLRNNLKTVNRSYSCQLDNIGVAHDPDLRLVLAQLFRMADAFLLEPCGVLVQPRKLA
jgi:hypothetical protein